MSRNNVLLVLVTRNPGDLFDDWIAGLNQLTLKPDSVWVIDSSSTDDTQARAKQSGFKLTVINKDDFNHGATRQFAALNSEQYRFIVFMTQDAIICNPDALEKILSAFSDVMVAAVCGRQIPRLNAGHIEAHARKYNYPDQSSVRDYEDRLTMGLKAAFLSNSFAAYRLSSLLEVGGFPEDVIFGEDMYVAARLLKAGYKIAYAADACVYHSHSYSLLQEFRRYFDMGVFHAREPWLQEEFGNAEGEGFKFVVSEMNYLANHAVWSIPEGLLRKCLNYLGFKLGLNEKRIPMIIKVKISMNAAYFN